MPVEYKAADVLTAARRRVAAVFEAFPRVVVSVSSGKDSTVLYHLALAEAAARDRRVEAFFLDQEAEYQSSIDLVGAMMDRPGVDPRWVQVPLRMTNATSHRAYFLRAWGPGEYWMRPRDPRAIHDLPGAPDRFYDFFPWFEAQATVPTAWLVGLRSKESFNRFRAISSHPAYRGWGWSTRTAHPASYRFYPIYDWTAGDVWKYIADHGVAYNRYYDRAFAKHGANAARLRVSNLVHEKSFRCLLDLQEFEPATYDRLVRRLGGVHCAALYAGEAQVYAARALPAAHATWRAWRDYLLATTPSDRAGRFARRFAAQGDDEDVCRQHCRQLLLNDWENNVPAVAGRQAALRARWWDRL